jgi:hypothetical protein
MKNAFEFKEAEIALGATPSSYTIAQSLPSDRDMQKVLPRYNADTSYNAIKMRYMASLNLPVPTRPRSSTYIEVNLNSSDAQPIPSRTTSFSVSSPRHSVPPYRDDHISTPIPIPTAPFKAHHLRPNYDSEDEDSAEYDSDLPSQSQAQFLPATTFKQFDPFEDTVFGLGETPRVPIPAHKPKPKPNRHSGDSQQQFVPPHELVQPGSFLVGSGADWQFNKRKVNI